MRLETDRENMEQYYEEFYKNVLFRAFPEEYLGSYTDCLMQLELAENNPDFDTDVRINIDVDGKVLCGARYRYFPSINSAVIEHIAVRDDARGHGIGHKLYNDVKAILDQRASQLGYKHLDRMFVEVSMHDRFAHPETFQFWDSLGFRALMMTYNQPNIHNPLGTSVKSLQLARWAHPDLGEGSFIPAKPIKEFVYNYFKYAFDLNPDDPKKCRPYREIDESLKDGDEIPTLTMVS